MEQRPTDLLIGGAVGVAGGLAGAVITDWLTRRRGPVRLPAHDATYQAEWTVTGPVRLTADDATYKVSWTITGPVQLPAQDTRVALHDDTP